MTFACGNTIIGPLEDRDLPLLRQRILVGERGGTGSHALGVTQCILGGFVNPASDPTLAHTSQRETEEETGLHISNLEFVGVAGPQLPQSTAMVTEGELVVSRLDGTAMNPETPIIYHLFRGWCDGTDSLRETEELKNPRFAELEALTDIYGDDPLFRSWIILEAVLKFNGTAFCL